MKPLIGIGLVLGGIVFGLYVGLWLCLIGGIVTIIQQLQAPNIEALTVAWAIVRIIFAGAAGVLSAFALILPGLATIFNE